MLSEGYILRCELEAANFSVPATHPNILSPGKSPGYRVGLGIDGLPIIVEELNGQEIHSLWYHIEGKQNAFPVIKVQHALLAIPREDSLRKRLEELKKGQKARLLLLREAMNSRNLQLSPTDEQTWERLRKKAARFHDIFSDEDGQFCAFTTMLNRFTKEELSFRDWLDRIARLIIQRLEEGQLQDTQLAETLLIGKLKPRGKYADAQVPLALDVGESDIPVRVGDPRMKIYVSTKLLKANREGGQRPKERCAMTGKERVLLDGAFPEVQLPELGNTKLFSKYDATPCEFRYIKKPNEWKDRRKSFPIGEDIVADIADAFRMLTAPNLKGKTWRMVANGKWEGKKEKRDLLLVYCEGQPVISDEAADTFGSDDQERRSQFHNDAKALCRALESIIKRRPESRLHLLVIGKVDKEKKQVVFRLTPTPQQVFDAAERWQRAVYENLPKVTLPLPSEKKGDQSIEGCPLPPYPDRVVRLLSSQWIRGGTEEQKMSGPSLRHVLDLMLRNEGRWEEAARNLLDLTVLRIGPLLIGVSAAFGSGEKEEKEKFKPVARETALRAVAVLGILLDALGRGKEIYMNDTAFQLGRLLALVDTLHREYCVHVRKGGIPPQLIGNSLMPAAADNPEDAIDRLRERINIYQAWAKGEGEERKLARWAVGQIGQICNSIKRPLPTATDQKFRAELFLGYMARSSQG
jgi:hypothetical protein